jgi:hypothetical protein
LTPTQARVLGLLPTHLTLAAIGAELGFGLSDRRTGPKPCSSPSAPGSFRRPDQSDPGEGSGRFQMIEDRTRSQTLSAGRRTTAAALLALLGVLALVAAGCGGGDSDKQANEAYADSVCTAIAGWEQQVKMIATTFTGSISKATLQSKVSQVESETRKLGTEIKAVPPPDTSDGQAAKQQLDQFSTDVTTTINSVSSAVTALKSNPSASEIAVTLGLLAPQVKSLVSSGEAAFTALKDAKGSLASAFKDTPSCQSLGNG